EEYHQTTEENS
ncbi:Late transcription factor VLTF-4 (1), partial [Monkeypox virus]